jgi:hypothetical protein
MRNKKQPIRFADVHTLARSKGAIEDVGGRIDYDESGRGTGMEHLQ